VPVVVFRLQYIIIVSDKPNSNNFIQPDKKKNIFVQLRKLLESSIELEENLLS
jgi:hypothetical protein